MNTPPHVPTTPQFTITEYGVSVTFSEYGSTQLSESVTRSIILHMRNLYARTSASGPDISSQRIVSTMFEIDYETPEIIMNWVPGFRATWATFVSVTNILEDFWREWDRVCVYFEVASEDGRQRWGEGFVATPNYRTEI